MSVIVWEQGTLSRAQTLSQALRFSGGMAAFVGGGGKSTLIAQLAQELCAAGARVIVTTTTHIRMPQTYVDPSDRPGICAALARGEIVTAGIPAQPGKLRGGDEEALVQLRDICDALLIEADGAHERPFKAPEAWEPALPQGAELVVGVAGASALCRPIAECHRPHIVAALCEKPQESLLEAQDMARVLQSARGQRKNVDCRYEIVINQADSGVLLERALAVARLCARAVLRGRGQDDADTV